MESKIAQLIKQANKGINRFRFRFKGVVQGVGFRPFIYRSAKNFNLNGYVKNSARGVILEVQGEHIDNFIRHIFNNQPPLSQIDHFEFQKIPLIDEDQFIILSSVKDESCEILLPPDIAICKNCQKELLSPEDRRYRYPFINCTDCGPRFTIINNLPYDRPQTTMKQFEMCPACTKEYIDPMDRRYHAQPVSCYDCGPELKFTPETDKNLNAWEQAASSLKQGQIIAIKGLGGYHLACLAQSDRAVLRLRDFKKRETKPFALMGSLDMIRQHCYLSPEEVDILKLPASPIVLLKRRQDSDISEHVAREHIYLGFMLPYTPLHLLITDLIKKPLVMTSANFSDEPIIYQDHDPALQILSDGILSHNRRINIFTDDSVAQVFENKPYMVRRSRGFVPRLFS